VVQYVIASKASSATAISSVSPNPSIATQLVKISFAVTANGTATGNVMVTASTGEYCSAAIAAGNCSIQFNTAVNRTNDCQLFRGRILLCEHLGGCQPVSSGLRNLGNSIDGHDFIRESSLVYPDGSTAQWDDRSSGTQL
jgi:hypothetical protein